MAEKEKEKGKGKGKTEEKTKLIVKEENPQMMTNVILMMMMMIKSICVANSDWTTLATTPSLFLQTGFEKLHTM